MRATWWRMENAGLACGGSATAAAFCGGGGRRTRRRAMTSTRARRTPSRRAARARGRSPMGRHEIPVPLLPAPLIVDLRLLPFSERADLNFWSILSV